MLTSHRNFDYISNMSVLDVNEHSDHCPISFSFKCQKSSIDLPSYIGTQDKLYWDASKSQILLDELENRRSILNDITNDILVGEGNFDAKIQAFTNITYNCSFKVFGKTTTTNKKTQKRRKN